MTSSYQVLQPDSGMQLLEVFETFDTTTKTNKLEQNWRNFEQGSVEDGASLYCRLNRSNNIEGKVERRCFVFKLILHKYLCCRQDQLCTNIS